MASKSNGPTPACTASPAAPPHDEPAQASCPFPAARPPVVVIRVHKGVEEKLRRAWTSCDEFLGWLSTLLAVFEETRAARRGPGNSDDASLEKKRKTRMGPRRLPPAWIKSIQTARGHDGSVEVIVNDVRMVLKPHLGALFLALGEDTGVSDDEGIGFKTLDELAARMAALTGGRTLSGQTINKYIHKLRERLITLADLSSDVIQSRYRLGRRLAIKRSTLRQSEALRLHAARSSSRSSDGCEDV